MKQEDPQVQYAIKLMSAIQSTFSEDSDNFIDVSQFQEGDNLAHFIHALANIVPNMIYNQFTREEMNNLEFNHIANHLVFQYANSIKEEGEEG